MRFIFLIGLIILDFAGSFSSLHAKIHPSNSCDAVYEFIEILDSNHVAPPMHDAVWASKVSSLLINGLDPRAQYLSLKDVSAINNLEPLLLQDIENDACLYLNRIKSLFEKRLNRVDSLLNEFEQIPLNFTESSEVKWFPGSSVKRAADERMLKLHWTNRIKSLILYKSYEKGTQPDFDNFDELAFAKQKELVRKLRCELLQITDHEEGYDSFFMGKFMDAISASYDPHSGYFSLTEKELWDLALSTDTYSFGLEFEKNRKGQLQISQLSPGGPAWKSQSLHQGDEILEIEYPQGKKLDIYCLSISMLVKELNSSQSNSIYLKIKKRNGEIRSLSLQKEKLQQEENIINSFILEGKRKMGYIYLPAFYTESEDETTRGCADDIARELLRLQAEGIEGLILDLRFNGGGSMKEALNLAGIFIDRGPLTIYEEKGKKATQLRDINRGSLYDGPMVLMMNGHSASASEILASALQDYERAVIVGSTSFGKSSGQIMLPVVGAGLGMAKVSIQRYYRIKGNSYQLEGVIPDIILPNIDQVIGTKERDYLSPFTHTTSPKKTVFEKSGQIPHDLLRIKSSGRVSENKSFQDILSLNQKLLQYKDQGLTFTLTPEAFGKSLKLQTGLLESMQKSLGEVSEAFQPLNNGFVESLLKLEPHKREVNQAQKNKIHKDIYIEEAYLILNDLIES